VSRVVDVIARRRRRRRRSGVLKSFVAIRDNNNTVDFAFAWLKSRKGLELQSDLVRRQIIVATDRALVSLKLSLTPTLANCSLLVKPKTCTYGH